MKMNNIVLFDIDNTLIKGQSQNIFLKYLFRHNLISFSQYLLISIWFILYKFHLVKHPLKIMKYAFAIFQNKSSDEIEKLANDFFSSELNKYFYSEVVNILKNHRENNARIILVSNSVDIIVKEVAKYLNVNEYICTRLKYIDNKFTGEIDGEIAYGVNKYYLVSKYLNIQIADSAKIPAYFYTDHISDLPLLEKVDVPVVVNPDTNLKKVAIENKWKILETSI